MDNKMVKRYPCRNYKRLLAAEALPMLKDSIKKAKLERFSILSLSTNRVQFKTYNVSNFNERRN